MKETRKIKVIGAGGIGGWLLEPLAQYLAYTGDNIEITVIDGDVFEERNKERQRFEDVGNKAEKTVELLRPKFPGVHWKVKKEYLTSANIVSSLREKDEIFLCVDNQATRKLVSDRCEELDDVLLINAGNEFTDGDVLIYERKNGKDVEPTQPLTKMYPKIAKPEDKNPGTLTDEERQGCQREAVANPQLIITNVAAASHMLNVYYTWRDQKKAGFSKVFFDILAQKSRPV